MKLYVGVRSTMLALCTFLRAFKNSLSKNPCTMPSPHTWTVYLHRRYDLSLRSVSTARPLTEGELVSLSSKGRLCGADSRGHPGLWSTTSWPGDTAWLFSASPLWLGLHSGWRCLIDFIASHSLNHLYHSQGLSL